MFKTKFRHVIGATMVVAMVFGSVGVAYSADKVVWNFNVWGGTVPKSIHVSLIS